MITPEQLVGWSALLAAVATVVGAVLLMMFFSRGEPWGTLNDIASIVLMLATIPVALLVATVEGERSTTWAQAIAALGIGAMLAAAAFQLALVLRIRTYEQLLGWTLGAGALVGVWYVVAGALALDTAIGTPLAGLMIASGIGFVAIGYGFAVGNERHPLSQVGGILLLVASTAFLGWIGIRLVTGDLVAPVWNG